MACTARVVPGTRTNDSEGCQTGSPAAFAWVLFRRGLGQLWKQESAHCYLTPHAVCVQLTIVQCCARTLAEVLGYVIYISGMCLSELWVWRAGGQSELGRSEQSCSAACVRPAGTAAPGIQTGSVGLHPAEGAAHPTSMAGLPACLHRDTQLVQSQPVCLSH